MIPLLIAVLLPLSQAQSAECTDKMNNLESSCKQPVITWATKVNSLRKASKHEEANSIFCDDFEKIAKCLSPLTSVCSDINISEEMIALSKKSCNDSAESLPETAFLDTLDESESKGGWVIQKNETKNATESTVTENDEVKAEAYPIGIRISFLSLMLLLF